MLFACNAQVIQLYLVDDVNCDPVIDAYIEYGDNTVFTDNYGIVHLKPILSSQKPTTVLLLLKVMSIEVFALTTVKTISMVRLHPTIYRFDDVVIAVNRLEDTLVRPLQFTGTTEALLALDLRPHQPLLICCNEQEVCMCKKANPVEEALTFVALKPTEFYLSSTGCG